MRSTASCCSRVAPHFLSPDPPHPGRPHGCQDGAGLAHLDEHVGDFWEPFFLRCDANNLLCQLWTAQESDISANATHHGDFDQALHSIRARTIVLPVDTDRYFPPPDSEYEAQNIPNGVCRAIPSIWGHMAPINPADVPTIDAALNELLVR
ncbi:MAG: hypothetical protein ACREFO_13325 [Acetobacteraceae bacterium]